MSDKKLTLAVDFVGVDKMSATTRKLSAASTATRDRIKALKDEVGSLNKRLADAKAMREATENLIKHRKASREAASNLAALKAQIVAGEAPTKKLVSSIQAAEKHLTKMKEAEKKAASGAKEMVANMRTAGIDVARLGQHEASLSSRIEKANASLKRQNSLLDGNDRRLKTNLRNERSAASQQRREDQARQSLEQRDRGRWSNMRSRGGQAAMTALGIAEQAADVGGNFQALSYRLRALGLNEAVVKDLEAYAKGMNIAGSSARDNMRFIVEAQGAFRESGAHSPSEQVAAAKLMAPIMARLSVSMTALGQELTPELERDLLRVVEMQGGLSNPKRAAELTDGLFRALISSGGNVNASNYQGFLARAGTAGMSLSKQALFADFEPLIAEMHDTAGVGLMTAYSRANGMVKNQAAMREMIRLGAWDQSKIIFNKVDGIKAFKNGENPLRSDLAATLQNSPVDFYIQMRKRYADAGVKDIQRENMMLFGNTGSKLFNLIEKQLDTLMKSRAAYSQTLGIGETHQMVIGGILGEKEKYQASLDNFNLSLAESGGVLSTFTYLLGKASSVLSWLNGTTMPAYQPPASYSAPVDWRHAGPPRAILHAASPSGGGRPGVDWSKAQPANPFPALAPVRPAAVAAGGAARAPVTQHIYAAPGQSEEAIANHVIRKMDHAQGVAGRSDMTGGDGR
ncbi:hypothetical protein FHW96_002354 [Novosphingobium sp. SG751A]|uniref:hypothetical protein n=1 Tax=Novosphingobium sp. SG751A TaxID=2587000 RepID=UPI001557C50F|nr:hypothetical protein [Novosphingobium sp. SG751A]NOW46196.1 hypothetical protein [Novosphingobium sp. SG751A]